MKSPISGSSSALVNRLYDERNPAVKAMLKLPFETANRTGTKVGIPLSGTGPAAKPFRLSGSRAVPSGVGGRLHKRYTGFVVEDEAGYCGGRGEHGGEEWGDGLDVDLIRTAAPPQPSIRTIH